MTAEKIAMRITIVTVLAFASALTPAQSRLLDGVGRPAAKPAAVLYLYPEQVTVPAGKPSVLSLHFRVAPGLHINSHTPREEFLIPTTFSIPASSGVRLDGTVYPPGAEFKPPLDPKTRLSVYAGEFIIQARIVAAAGDHMVEAKLRYQACDNNECMPPKTITAAMDVIGK